MIAFDASDRRNGIVAAVALAAFALALFAPGLLNDADSWWHVKVGTWILDHGRAPRTDLWSYARAGAPWTAHEWLSEVAMAAAWRAGGWAGVVALAAAAFGAAAWLLGRRLARDLDGVALAASLILGLSLTIPGLLARPHLLALPVLAAWTAGLVAARDRGTAPSLKLAPLMVLWANLHGGWAFGLALTAALGLEATVAAGRGGRLTAARDWGLFGLAAFACALVTPFGLEGALFPLKLLSMRSLERIGEWGPIDLGRLQPIEIALAAVAGFALSRPLRVEPLRLLLLSGLALLAFGQTRHQTLLGVAGPMLLAGPMARALGPKARETTPAGRRGGAVWGLVALALLGLRLALPVVRGDSATAPMTAVSAVPAAVRAKPMLNDYAFGGYLIWRDLPPFVDSRAELYGDAFLDDYAALAGGEARALDAALDGHDVAWTIFAPGQPVVRLMDARPGWRRLYGDRFAVVHVRGPAGGDSR